MMTGDADPAQAVKKKLSALGIEVVQQDARQPVRGGWTFKTRVVAPFTGAVIPGADFVVEGTALRFADPPLDALPPVPFVACNTKDDLERAVGAALDERVTQLQRISRDAARLRIKAVVDPQRLVATMQLKTDTGTFHLEGSPDGVRCVRVVRGRGPMDIPADVGTVNLTKHDDAADLELHLQGRVPQWAALDDALRAEAASAPAHAPDVTPPAPAPQPRVFSPSEMPRSLTPAPRPAPSSLDALLGAPDDLGVGLVVGVAAAPAAIPAAVPAAFDLPRSPTPAAVSQRLTLAQLIDRLGPNAHLMGPAIVVDGIGAAGPWRLALRHRDAFAFDAEVSVNHAPAPVWQGAVDLAGVRSAAALVEQIVRAPAAPASTIAAGAGFATLICVEQMDAHFAWFTYSGPDGRGVGSPTQVARRDFERTFALIGDDWFLRVIVQAATEHTVAYVACNSAGQPEGGAHEIARTEFVALFRPL